MGFSYNVNVLNQKGTPAIYTDTFANRPAPGFAGRLFVANDTAAIYEDTGTAWVLIANVSSGALYTMQQYVNGSASDEAKSAALKSTLPQIDNSNNRVIFNVGAASFDIASNRLQSLYNNSASANNMIAYKIAENKNLSTKTFSNSF